MACLPDEVWTEALQAGVCRGLLGYRDLCCLALASRTLNRLSSLASIWKLLFLRDFPEDSSNSSDYKSAYRARFEKIEAAKVAAHKRQFLRLQSEQYVLQQQMNNLVKQIQEEQSKLSKIAVELRRLEQARRSSTALQLWQPEIVRSMQQQLVEQQPIDSEFRQHSLEMEAKLCKEEIKGCRAGMARKQHALEQVKKKVEFMSYNPMQVLHEESRRPTKRLKQQMKADKGKT